jgi:polar amino acid transport system substrate-binding protein
MQHPAPEFTYDLVDVDAAARHALVTTGRLRAGINLSNPLLVTGRTADGEPTGVSPSMATALAKLLGVGIELVGYERPGPLADAARDDVWDIGNIGDDPARAEHIRFSRPYCEIDATYLVRAGSGIVGVDDVDRAGRSVVTNARAAYCLWLERNLEHADLVRSSDHDESAAWFVEHGHDAIGGLRPRLTADAERMPGTVVLRGSFTTITQSIGTPRSRPELGVQLLDRFVGAALESGFVADLIEHHGAQGLSVASRC